VRCRLCRSAKASSSAGTAGGAAVADLRASELVSGSAHESGEVRIFGNPERVDAVTSTSGRVVRPT
jgi:hypothetical protein